MEKQLSYDEQIVYLTENPRMIVDAWYNYEEFTLFKPLESPKILSGSGSLCPTELRSRFNDGYEFSAHGVIVNGEVDIKLTKEITEDERIPNSPLEIKPSHLPIFKEIQERIDNLQTIK